MHPCIDGAKHGSLYLQGPYFELCALVLAAPLDAAQLHRGLHPHFWVQLPDAAQLPSFCAQICSAYIAIFCRTILPQNFRYSAWHFLSPSVFCFDFARDKMSLKKNSTIIVADDYEVIWLFYNICHFLTKCVKFAFFLAVSLLRMAVSKHGW